MNRSQNPSVRSRSISTQLRRLREEAGMTGAQLARSLGMSASKISRMETGKRGLQVEDVAAVLGLLQVPETRRDQILDQVRRAGERGWWHGRAIGMPEILRALIDFESRATEVRNFENMFVPGLLQTPEYAAAVIAASGDRPVAPQGVDRLVAFRMARQSVLSRGRVRLHAVVDEVVLRRRVGEPGVMRRQLQHLRHQARRDNVQLRVVPTHAGVYPGMAGAFALLDFADEPSLVFMENQQVALFLDERADVSACRAAMARILAAALSPAQSMVLLDRLVERME